MTTAKTLASPTFVKPARFLGAFGLAGLMVSTAPADAAFAAAAIGGTENTGVTRSKDAEARRRYQRGEEHFAAERFAEALAEYEAGYQAAPLPGFLINIGHCYRRLEQPEKARAAYRQFTVAAPDSPLVSEVRALIRELDIVIADTDAPAPPTGLATNGLATNGAASPTISTVPSEAPPRDTTLALDRDPTDRDRATRPVAVDLRRKSEQEIPSMGPTWKPKWWLLGTLTVAVVGGTAAAWMLAMRGEPATLHDGSLGTLRR